MGIISMHERAVASIVEKEEQEEEGEANSRSVHGPRLRSSELEAKIDMLVRIVRLLMFMSVVACAVGIMCVMK